MHQAMLSFNAGEVTPYLRHRIDFEKTSSSAELLQNFIAMPYGGVIKRPGLRYVATTLKGGTNSKAFAFMSSDGTKYIIHFSGYVAGSVAGSIKIYRAVDGTVAATLSDSATDGPAPSYLWTDSANPMRSLQMVAVNDIAYFSHANLHPFQIRRMSDTYWKLEFVPFETPPLLDENTDEDITLMLVSNPQATTWTNGVVYHVGQVVTYSGADWTCIKSNTASTISNFPSVGHATWWTSGNTGTPQWVNGAVYAAGDVVIHGDSEWKCILGHTASNLNNSSTTSNEPGVGRFFSTDITAWSAWWVRNFYPKGTKVKLIAAGLPAWVNGTAYTVGTKVYVTGVKYVCRTAHTAATSTNKPGSGSGWTTYWDATLEVFPTLATTAQSPGDFFELKVNRNDDDHQRDVRPIYSNDGEWSDPIQMSGGWQFFTFGSWYGTLKVAESQDNGVTWKQLRMYHAAGDRNVADSGEVEDGRLLRLGYTRDASTKTDPCNGTLAPDDTFVQGRVRVVARTNAEELTAVVVNPLISGTTFRWSKSAFTANHGFPKALCLHESRLCYAATTTRPVSIWLSCADDFMNFTRGTDADQSIFVTLATALQAPIQWMSSQRRLFIGTSLGEWVAGSETNDSLITPSSCVVHQYAANGSVALQPLLVGPALLFASRAGGRLCEMSYASDTEVYDTADLSRLAEHLTHPGIQSMAWQQTREPGLWCVRKDGVLLHFAYSRMEKIAAWSKHSTASGLFRDVVVFPSDAGDDEVFFIVDRGAATCLERFPQHWQAAIEDGAAGLPWFHLDGCNGSGTTITIPSHLRSVALTKVTLPAATPAAVPTVASITYSAGTETITSAAWQIGYPVESRLTSLPIDTTLQDGTSQARRKRQHKLICSLFRSRGGYVWNTSEARKQVIANTQTSDVLRTGWEETIPDAGHLDDLQLHIMHADPWPFCLRAAVMRWRLHEA